MRMTDEAGREQAAERRQRLNDAIGRLLVTAGALVACWVAYAAYGIFTEPAGLSPWQALVSGALEAMVTEGGEQDRLVLPPEVLAYAIPIALLCIGVAIAGVLINGGVRLLQNDVQLILKRLSCFRHNVSEKLDDIKRRFPG